MQLYEKLDFLMNITQTSNRLLAQELQVDPSLVSRLRTGTRGMPRNREQVRRMAECFARRCMIDFQRQALSELLGIKQALTMKSDQLSEILYYWLCGDTDSVGHFMRTLETLNVDGDRESSDVDSCSLSTSNSIYYGNDGKRAAARAVFQHLLSLSKPGTILLFADEADDWIIEDYSFTSGLQGWALELFQRGFRICQITPPIVSADQAFESLIRWLPAYITGQVEAYYYPRLRDNVHRRSMIVLPGEIAMLSNSTAGRRSSYATIVTTDRRLTKTYAEEFQDYLSLCRLMLHTYTTMETLMHCFTQFLACEGPRIQKLPSLSAETMPPELMDYCVERERSTGLNSLSSFFLQDMEVFKGEKDSLDFIDIARLASADEVRTGTVPVIASFGTEEMIYYTPETYVSHLQNILRMMELCENYHFVPLTGEADKDGMLMIKGETRALLVRAAAPFTTFEISQPEIVALCREHLLRTADKIGFGGIHRVKTMSQLRELIRILQA